MMANAMYVPSIPKEAMVGKKRKNAFLRTDSPACRIMGGRKKLHPGVLTRCQCLWLYHPGM